MRHPGHRVNRRFLFAGLAVVLSLLASVAVVAGPDSPFRAQVGLAQPVTQSLDVTVRASSDDAEENSRGGVSLTSTHLELVTDGSIVQTVGLRFPGVVVPRNATITNAYVQFQVDEVSTGTAVLTIRGFNADNAGTFTTATGNLVSREDTTASVEWRPPDWTSVGTRQADQRTPSLANVIQEIVNRGGWASGNALALFVTGTTGRRTAEAFDGSVSGAPQLHVDYQTGGTGANRLLSLISDVTTATAYRYGATDDRGSSMDTLKIIGNSSGGYVGVYHTLVNNTFNVKVASSSNLISWTYQTDLATNASQPTIYEATDGSFVVAYEADLGCTGLGGSTGNCLMFRHYQDSTQLFSGIYDRQVRIARTLSRCAEGTPNIYSVTLNPNIDNSSIDVGYHYFRDCDVDRQARGTLTNFSTWSGRPEAGHNTLFEDLNSPSVGGNVGDRDCIVYHGDVFNIHEAQLTKGDFGSWRGYLYDWTVNALMPISVRTHRGSTAFANPTFTNLTSPTGRPAVVVTYFLPLEGAALGEAAGELIFYTEY